MRLVHPRHQYGHISVTRLGNTRHKFYQWHVSFARVTDIFLLVTHIVPRAWATINQWRVSFTCVTNILIVTRFFFKSLIEASLISFSGIVQHPVSFAGMASSVRSRYHLFILSIYLQVSTSTLFNTFLANTWWLRCAHMCIDDEWLSVHDLTLV
jgi:hypothetical protein